MAAKGKYGKIIFSQYEIEFIKTHFKTMTNTQISNALGLKKTIVRMKAYELGLQRMTLEYWSDESVVFLKANYHKIGNKELVNIFTKRFPKQKKWTISQIQKKLHQLKLKRNKLHLFSIKERNRRNGSFGNINSKNNPKPPKVFFSINAKTRVELKPEQTIEGLKEKYKHLIMSNKTNL